MADISSYNLIGSATSGFLGGLEKLPTKRKRKNPITRRLSDSRVSDSEKSELVKKFSGRPDLLPENFVPDRRVSVSGPERNRRRYLAY